MKNKNFIRVAFVLFGTLDLISFKGLGQISSSFSFAAVNGYTVPIVTVTQDDPTTMVTNTNLSTEGVTNLVSQSDETSMTSNGVSGIDNGLMTLYPAVLSIRYAVPIQVFLDWRYVNEKANSILVNSGYNAVSVSLFGDLAWTGFNSYSENRGFEQKLELRRGNTAPYNFTESFPPIQPNTNPVFKTVTFKSK